MLEPELEHDLIGRKSVWNDVDDDDDGVERGAPHFYPSYQALTTAIGEGAKIFVETVTRRTLPSGLLGSFRG